jgi:hypothetical protein
MEGPQEVESLPSLFNKRSSYVGLLGAAKVSKPNFG